MQIRVYYEDTDCGGILYHTNYIKYCERARSELFFLRKMLPSQANAGFVLSSLQAQFLGFARLGDTLEVRSKILKIGKVQVLLLQEIFKISNLCVLDSNTSNNESNMLAESRQDVSKQQPEKKIFSAQVRLGYVDVVSQKPMPIPKHLEKIFLELGSGTH